jgi:hypothetical protein
VNLLERFVLQHLQLTLLNVEVIQSAREQGTQEAKVELNLAPRVMKADSGRLLPAYQVSARLICRSGPVGKEQPQFRAQVGMEAVYQQLSGEPVDIAEFTSNHASLGRQLYPLLQQELRVLMNRVGLEQIRLPFDLAAQIGAEDHEKVEVSGLVH